MENHIMNNHLTYCEIVKSKVLGLPEKVKNRVKSVVKVKPPKQRNNKCKFCDRVFETKNDLKHIKEHDRNIIECPIEGCSVILESFPCVLAPKALSRAMTVKKESMKRHVVDKHLPQSFECQHCDRIFSRRDARKDHLRTFHGSKYSSFDCTICDKRYVNKSRLKQHFQIHCEKKDKECPHCHKTYTHKQSYYKCKSKCTARIGTTDSKEG